MGFAGTRVFTQHTAPVVHQLSPEVPMRSPTTTSLRVASFALAGAVLSGVACTALTPTGAHAQSGYDPLAVQETAVPVATHDWDVRDVTRQRTIPIRMYRPPADVKAVSSGSPRAAPVLLFSHGLGGARTNNAYLGTHWARRGYVVVFLQHAGSDEAVWKDVPLRKRMAAMRKAANAENLQLRVADVTSVLDQLSTWNNDAAHALHGTLDLTRVGMSGHSFGAVTTQSVSGQRPPVGVPSFRDSRIDAALMMSPSVPQRGSAAAAFGAVDIPWLLMTGTKDVSAIGNTSLDDRLAVFAALPNGSKYELVLHNAEHSAFSDTTVRPGTVTRNPNHYRAILALSTAFWDAQLRGDAAALYWLDSDSVRTVLESEDRWQRK